MELRDVLKMLRGELGMNQSELANALHVSFATVNRWEAGKTCPNRSMMPALTECAQAYGVSDECRSRLEDALKATKKERIARAQAKRTRRSGRQARLNADGLEASHSLAQADACGIDAFAAQWDAADATLARDVAKCLLGIDYETITTIDAETGEAHPYMGRHIQTVIREQQAAGNNVIGVEAYLRKYCADEDVEGTIKATSLRYVKEQLKTRAYYTVAYSLRQNETVIYKRAVYAYLNRQRKLILCAMQDLTELHTLENAKRDLIADAMQILQEQAGMNVARYDFKTKTFFSNSEITTKLGYGKVIPNVPDEFIDKGLIAPAYVDEYRGFYQRLVKGEAAAVTVACSVAGGGFHWLRFSARPVFDGDNKPYQAIIAFKDVGEEREKAAIYVKWRQSIQQREAKEYTLFCRNLSKGSAFDKAEGTLIKMQPDPKLITFNERARDYACRCVHLDDFDAYLSVMNSENLLAGYCRGTRTQTLDYRERVREEEYRWIHLTVEMAQYPDSTDVEAFLMHELSAPSRVEALEAKARADGDPLTGVLNRRAFMDRFNELTAGGQLKAKAALMLINIDGFRRINESFGHAVGDQALIDMAAALKAVVQEDGFVGRLGGNEFLICLTNASGRSLAEQKAAQLLAGLRKAFSVDVRLTASLGIAFYPDDGADFSALYHGMDRALYIAKENGGDAYAFYSGGYIKQEKAQDDGARSGLEKRAARCILLADGDEQTKAMLERLYGEACRIEDCTGEKAAVAYIQRNGISLAAILLSLSATGLDGLKLLERIRDACKANAVPIVVLGRADQRELCLRALSHGAGDFVLEPVKPELLKTRLESAASKAENERLRAQNTYLQTQNSDAAKFRSVYEHTGTVVVEYDWHTHAFVYDPAISEYLDGCYDDRSLWQILMADMVADVRDVKAMQNLILDLAQSDTRTSGALDILLKTPSKAKHWFTLNAIKRVNDRNLTSKIIITFQDVNEDMLASKKLRFLAEHDSLTGLLNRASFLKLVEENVSLRPGASYLLLYCNVNDFKYINERFSREEGDRLLQYAADKIGVYTNAMNGFAGRLSNDIYAVLLPNNPGVLERTEAIIRDFFKDYPLKTTITGRSGAYIIQDPTMTADAMIDLAALAANTIQGKYDAWLAVYDESMNEKRLREKWITDRMEAALAEGQFEIYLQPQFDHATGQIVGAEALARWIDPEKGVIAPAEFIPVFERNGFITKLDASIWEKAASRLNAWMAKGGEMIPISVNVSREDTNDPDLCQKLLRLVNRYHISIHLFRLEITESLFTEDTQRLIAVVEQLHNAGFLIEMDDFGSGYSSLNILKDVPVDILKLDMRFFAGSDNLGRGGMIINAVLRMSRWLNIPVIAEGVEAKTQADFLLSMGCPTIQGFFYEKPMPADQFEKMLAAAGNRRSVPENVIRSDLDTCDFWNPTSADSQVFNHYIGPAAVFEYHAGRYEILRMNQRFIQAMRVSEPDGLRPEAIVPLDEEDRLKFKKTVLDVIYTGGEVKSAATCVFEDGSRQLVRFTLRVAAKSADRALIFAELEA